MCRSARLVSALGGVALVTACTIPPPSGPTVLAIPPPAKNLAVFQQEDRQCQSYAAATIGALPPGPVTAPAPGSSAVGTGSAAAAPPAYDATTGDAGATIGGAPGYAGNVAAGATYAASSVYDVQTRYDIAYTQCVYSSGNAVLPMPASVYAFAGEEYPWSAIPGSIGLGWASPELASSYSTGTTNSITASTVSMGDFTVVRTRAGCMAAEGTGAADPRPFREG